MQWTYSHIDHSRRKKLQLSLEEFAFLDLLAATYALDISYNRTVYLTHTLPRAVDGLAPSRRSSQIQGLTRVIRENERLADEYIRGLTQGLHLLGQLVVLLGGLADGLDQLHGCLRRAEGVLDKLFPRELDGLSQCLHGGFLPVTIELEPVDLGVVRVLFSRVRCGNRPP